MRIARRLIIPSLVLPLLAATAACSSTSETTTATTATTALPATTGSAPGTTAGTPVGTTSGTVPGTTTGTARTNGTTAATGPAGTAPSSTVARAANEVTVEGYEFTPATLSVTVGTQVVWTNQDEADHWVLSQGNDPATKVLDSQPFGQGATYQHTFTEPGTYAYFCNIHNTMKGTIVVS